MPKWWVKSLVWLKPIGLGILVYAIGGLILWAAVISLIPGFWSAIVMIFVLWAYLKYFSGSWAPASTKAFRKKMFRDIRLSKTSWVNGILSTLLFVLIVQSALVVTFRIIPFPEEAFKAGFRFESLALWQAWLFIVVAAAVAGITEEVGFRGYMQTQLEESQGVKMGIIITSIFFMLLHLNQAWAPFVLIHLFIVGALFGTMAYATNSLIIPIIAHVLVDTINFSYWWSDVAGKFHWKTISVTGVDTHFMLWVIFLILSLGGFAWVSYKLIISRSQNAHADRISQSKT